MANAAPPTVENLIRQIQTEKKVLARHHDLLRAGREVFNIAKKYGDAGLMRQGTVMMQAADSAVVAQQEKLNELMQRLLKLRVRPRRHRHGSVENH